MVERFEIQESHDCFDIIDMTKEEYNDSLVVSFWKDSDIAKAGLIGPLCEKLCKQLNEGEDWEYGINLTIETRFRGILGATYTLTTPHREV